MRQFLRRVSGQGGLSLTDLLVTSSILTAMSGLIFGTVQFQGKFHRREFTRAVSYAESRIGFQQMLRELRLAGFDPRETGSFGVTVHKATEVWFTYDKDRDGALAAGAAETRAFRYANGTLSRWTGGTGWRPVVTGIADFGLTYRNANGILLAESSSEKVAIIEVSMTSTGGLGAPGEGAMVSVSVRNRS